MTNIITPILAQWDITKGCNFTCPFCLSNSGKEAKDELDFKQARIVVDKLHAGGVLFLRILGGEPFYRKDMLKIMRYAVNKGLLMTFSTNGSLVTEETAKTLKEIQDNISYFQISLYGTNQHFYQDFTNNPRGFELVERGIKCLKKYDLNPYIFWVLTVENINQLEAAYQLTKKWELPTLRISLKLNLGRGEKKCGGDSVKNTNLWTQAIEKLLLLKSFVDKHKTPTVQLHARPFLGEYLYKLTGLPYFYIPCKAATTMLYVDSEGKCSPCPFGCFMPQSYSSSLDFNGSALSLLEYGIDDIWQSELFQSYRKLKSPELNPKEMNTSCPHYKSENCAPCVFTPCLCKSTIQMIKAGHVGFNPSHKLNKRRRQATSCLA
ncbi:MAG: radical SAM protein [Planctomycetes bacterium]|nr:radical SAM protein [Planctomycetota bacterium]